MPDVAQKMTEKPMTRIGVLGAGPMGLTTAYLLSKKGFQVDVYEADDRIGGMSASFNFGGMTIERYFHFICGPDIPLFDLLHDLGMQKSLYWIKTNMGFFYNGRLYKWDGATSLLSFSELDLVSKLRYGIHALLTRNRNDWAKLDMIEASYWLKRWIGKKAYSMLWRPLLEKKFFEHFQPLSAAWLAARIRRVARSRKNIFIQKLGYLEGGTQILLSRLQEQIEKRGGKVHLNSRVERVMVTQNEVKGIQTKRGSAPYNVVVSTIPLPYVLQIIPHLPRSYQNMIHQINNIGVVCVVYKLKHPLTRNFWLNINDPRIDIPGLIEYTNLRPLEDHILYAPYYMPQAHRKWDKSEAFFIDEVTGYLSCINPSFRRDWVIDADVFRYYYAQPVCTPNFYDRLPPIKTDIRGLYVADTTHAYPEDRSVSESIRIATAICQMIGGN